MSSLSDFCNRRIVQFREHMGVHGLDIICIFKGGGRSEGYTFKRIANTSTGSAIIIPMDSEPTLICSSMDANDAVDASTINVYDRGSIPLDEAVVEFVNNCLGAGRKIGYNLGSLSQRRYDFISKGFAGETFDIKDTILPEVLFGPYPEELKFQRKASELADIGVEAVIDHLNPGITEYELAAEAVYAMRKAGAEDIDFCIANIGLNSAHIHGIPSENKLRDGDLVMVDLGPVKHGYLADITRTFLVGDDPKKQHMLESMDKSVQAALDLIKSGVSCKEVDAISRKVLIDHGFPDYVHSLGHPLSGFVKPTVSKRSEDVEKVGYVHTVEPGIYLAGIGGVRFEENVYVTEDGHESFFKSPRLY
jgi:Xaa-Pro aminopeptidase